MRCLTNHMPCYIDGMKIWAKKLGPLSLLIGLFLDINYSVIPMILTLTSPHKPKIAKLTFFKLLDLANELEDWVQTWLIDAGCKQGKNRIRVES